MSDAVERESFEFSYPGEPTRRVRGRVHRPEGSGEVPWVLVLHGFKGFFEWGFFPWLCDSIARHGMAAIAFNASGSGVGPDGESFDDLEAFRRDTLSRHAEDIERVRDLALAGRFGRLSPTRRGVFGHSRGGGMALVHAAEDGAYRAVATWAALDSFDRWDEATKQVWRRTGEIAVLNARTGQELPMGVGMLDDYERHAPRFDVLACARRLRAPLLLLHGDQDSVVPVSAGRALQAAAPNAEPLVALEGEGHTFGATHPLERIEGALERAVTSTASWLARRLGEGGAAAADRA